MSWRRCISWQTRLPGRRQADLELVCQACCAEAIARLNQIVAALSVAGAILSIPVMLLEPVKPVAAYLAATGQMMSSVVTLDRRRASKARAGRAPVQPNPGQADENASLCLGVHKIPGSQEMVGSHRGLAIHSRNKQGRPPISNRDETIRYGRVSTVLKTAVGRQSEGGLNETAGPERVAHDTARSVAELTKTSVGQKRQ